jgi:hypothetical protein
MSEREKCVNWGRPLPRSKDGRSPFVWCSGCSARWLSERVEDPPSICCRAVISRTGGDGTPVILPKLKGSR